MSELWGKGGVQNLADHSRYSRKNLGDPVPLDQAHELAMRTGSTNLLRALWRSHKPIMRNLEAQGLGVKLP